MSNPEIAEHIPGQINQSKDSLGQFTCWSPDINNISKLAILK